MTVLPAFTESQVWLQARAQTLPKLHRFARPLEKQLSFQNNHSRISLSVLKKNGQTQLVVCIRSVVLNFVLCSFSGTVMHPGMQKVKQTQNWVTSRATLTD